MRRTLGLAIIAVGRRMPLGWRLKITWSPLGQPIRRFLNASAPERFPVVALSGPLRGYKMRLDWQTQKGFVFAVYPPVEAEVMAREVNEGDIACDLGAHVGYFTLLLATLVGPAGRVVAFEPLPQNARFVEENARLNGFAQIEVVPKAVLDSAQTVEFATADDDPLTMTGYLAASKGRWTVEATSLDEHFTGRAERISFVKVDVQGVEARVLAGMRRILAEHRPVLLIELHDVHAYGANHPALAHLRDAGYVWTHLEVFPPPPVVHEAHVLARPAEGPRQVADAD